MESSLKSSKIRKVVLLSRKKVDTAHEHLCCVAISYERFKELNTVRSLFLYLFILSYLKCFASETMQLILLCRSQPYILFTQATTRNLAGKRHILSEVYYNVKKGTIKPIVWIPKTEIPQLHYQHNLRNHVVLNYQNASLVFFRKPIFINHDCQSSHSEEDYALCWCKDASLNKKYSLS